VVRGGLGAIGRMFDEGSCPERGWENSSAEGTIVADEEAARTTVERRFALDVWRRDGKVFR
jgi:hypothetical protein